LEETVVIGDNVEVLLCVVVLLCVELVVLVLVDLIEAVWVLLIIPVILRFGLFDKEGDELDVLEFETLLVIEGLPVDVLVPREDAVNDPDELEVLEFVDVVVPVLVDELVLLLKGDALYVFVANDDTEILGLEEEVLLDTEVSDEIFVGKLVRVPCN
jgi:hypothetical protein